MRRIAIAAVVIGGVAIIGRRLAPRLHARMLAACKGMFEQMPDDLPPKKILSGIEEIRATTARTLALLEERVQTVEAQPFGEPSSIRPEKVEMVHA